MYELIAIIIGIIINAVTWLYVTKAYLPNLMEDVVEGIGLGLGENITKMMEKPTVKKAFSIIGTQGGDAKSMKVAEQNFTGAILQKQIGMYKPLIQGVLGIDLDQAIEDYGAPAILELVNKYAPMLKGMIGGKGKTNNTPPDTTKPMGVSQ